ncbi:MAG: DNA polymerase V family protein [Bdellovibrionaceae bacterium]|nr:DNA polymerase V family protein [Pseudobdellovibrionaceae bacterium]
MNGTRGLQQEKFEDLDENLDNLEDGLEEGNENELDASEPSEEESFDSLSLSSGDEEDDDINLDEIDNILELPESKFPRFTLAKNKARFLRMVSWYRGKEEWIEVAPLSGVTKLFKSQTKELEGIRSAKMDYEMELETGTLTPSQRSYRRDELKMCKVQEKMAVHLISKLQVKIKSGRR